MKEISCKETCKMTAEMQNSKFCNGKAKIVDGKIFYGCKENIAKEPVELRQLMTCELWDAGLKESCRTCSLKCVNNKNPNMEKTREEREKLEKLIEQLKPNMILHNVTADEVEKISRKYTEKNSRGERSPIGSEAIAAANFANEALKMALNGGRLDIAYLTLYAKKMSGRIKKHKKNKK
jgi:hypothetical protein